jgi:hypothetical protein
MRCPMSDTQGARELGEFSANLKNLEKLMSDGFSQLNKKIDGYRTEAHDEIERIRATTENFRIVHEESDSQKFKRVYEKIDFTEAQLSNRISLQEKAMMDVLTWKAAEEKEKQIQAEQKEKSWGHKVLTKLKDRIGDGFVLFVIGFGVYLLWQYLQTLKP